MSWLFYAGSCSADITDCIESLNRLDQALVTKTSTNSSILKQAFDLRHEGEQLCLAGDTQAGLDKLKRALALFPADALPSKPNLSN